MTSRACCATILLTDFRTHASANTKVNDGNSRKLWDKAIFAKRYSIFCSHFLILKVDLLSFPQEFLNSPEWKVKGYKDTPYLSYLIKDNDVINNKEQYELLLHLFKNHLHGENLKITRAFAVQSEGAKIAFNHYVNGLANNYRQSPSLFRKVG
jgi:hypothetical protein